MLSYVIVLPYVWYVQLFMDFGDQRMLGKVTPKDDAVSG